MGKFHIITTHRVQFAAYFKSCKISQLYHQARHLRTAKIIALKVQSFKLYNSKYMIASTQITNTKIFAFIAVLVFKLLDRKVLVNYCKVINS